MADFSAMIPAGKAQFFSDDGFRGNMLEMDVYTFNEARLTEMSGWNDVISSIRLGEGVRLKMCIDGCENNEWWKTIELVGPYNTGAVQGINDAISHILIYPYDSAKEKYVEMFDDGWDVSHTGLFTVGEYLSGDFYAHHVEGGGTSGSVTSIIIPSGLYIQVFNEDNYMGSNIIIMGPNMVNLLDGNYNGWNDNIRSMYVRTIDKLKVECYWASILSSNSKISKSIEVGWSQ